MSDKFGGWLECALCKDAGWVWWYELDDYDGPALQDGTDDTRYSCPECRPADEIKDIKND